MKIMRPAVKEALEREIPLIAKKIGRNFPNHIMDTEDFIQEGWLGALKVKEKEEWDDTELIIQCRKAAWGRSVDAVRRFRDLRGVRDLEVIVDDISTFDKYITSHIDYPDFPLIIKNLSLREKTILWMLMADYTLAEIGEKLNLTQGRIHQIRSGLFTYLKKVL